MDAAGSAMGTTGSTTTSELAHERRPNPSREWSDAAAVTRVVSGAQRGEMAGKQPGHGELGGHM